MRLLLRYAALSAGLLLGVSALPGAVAQADEERASARPGRVSFTIPRWTIADGEHRTTVHVRYPSDEPPAWWDGQPLEIQVRNTGGSWVTVGEADQRPLPGKPASRTSVTYSLPVSGTVQIRARAHSTGSTVITKRRTFTVAAKTPAYKPTALPRTRYNCWDPVIGYNPSNIAYGCPGDGEYGYNTWLYNARDDDKERLDTYTDYPELATGANVALAHALVYFGEDLDTYRALRYDLDTGKWRWIAYKRNGKRAREAVDATISAKGRRIAYSSSSRNIAPKAPRGQNVYAVHENHKYSRYLGRGSESEIAAFGRYVVWRNPAGKIKRYDLRKGRRIAVTKQAGHRRSAPDVSAGGRFITYSELRKGHRIVRVYDAKTHERHAVGRGTSPVMSDNGKYVAYLGEKRKELYLWSRETAQSSLVTVGPSGDGSGARLAVPDISPSGRWIVAATRSAKVAPDNGRNGAKNNIVLFDRRHRPRA